MRKSIAALAGHVLTAALVSAASAAAPAGSDAPGDSIRYRMNAVQVTASKLPQAEGNATQKIDILDRATLSARVLGNRNLAELVSLEAGAAVSVLSRNDANWGAYGGIGPKYSTVMLSGLPVDGFVDPQSLDPSVLERVEVQRGPASVLYPNYLSQDFAGNQSPLAGTVNLVLNERVSAPATEAWLGGGSYSTWQGRVAHRNRFGPVHAFAGASHERSDYTNYGTTGSWLNMIDNPEYTKTRLFGGATWFIGNDGTHKASAFGHGTWHRGDAGRPNRGYDHGTGTAQAAYSVPLGASSSLNARAGWRSYNRSWEEDRFSEGGASRLDLASVNGVTQTIVPADVMFETRRGRHGLAAGLDYQSAAYETWSEPVGGTRGLGNKSRSGQVGVYAQDVAAFGRLVLRAGGRWTTVGHEIDLLSGGAPGDPERSWSRVLWNAGARFNVSPSFSPFANAGSGFMAPGLKSVGGTLRADDRGVAGKHGQLPNPDLKPESGTGLDAGFDWMPLGSLRVSARGFMNTVDDAIVENVVSTDPSQSLSVNAGSTRALGFEVGVRHSLSRRLSWFANATVTDTEIRNDFDPDQDGAAVPFVPGTMANAGVTATLPAGFEASVSLHAAGGIYDSSSKSGRRKFDPIHLVNLQVRREMIRAGGLVLETFVDLYNITDNRFEMPWQFQDPGFSANGGIHATF